MVENGNIETGTSKTVTSNLTSNFKEGELSSPKLVFGSPLKLKLNLCVCGGGGAGVCVGGGGDA